MENKDYFKWLIDDAIDLRKDIDSVTNDIVHARLNNDDEVAEKQCGRWRRLWLTPCNTCHV